MYFVAEFYWNQGGRDMNQDSVVLQEAMIGKEKVWFGAVCDGVGGMEKGETASGYTAEQLIDWFYAQAVPMIGKKNSAVKIAKAGIRRLFEVHKGLETYGKKAQINLGTTASVLLLYRRKCLIWHVGDSRIYQMKPWKNTVKVNQLTADHARGAQILLKCINSMRWQKPDTYCSGVKKGQVFLLCSDGFARNTDKNILAESLGTRGLKEYQLQKRLKEIAQSSVRNGELDNMSALVVRIEG